MRKDLTNKKFGRLTVIRRADDIIQKNGRRRTAWVCICDCNPDNEIVVRTDSLTSGNTTSCGCYEHEVHCNYRKYNRYELHDGYVKMYTHNDIAFLIDAEDLEKVREYSWSETRGYIVAGIKGGKGTTIALSRFLTNCPDDKIVDHKNGNTLDNRKCNLRIVTRHQNNVNKKINSRNKSGCTGVYWEKSTNKWRAFICIDGKSLYLGRYNDFEDAVKIRRQAEDKYYGEYSFYNSRNQINEVKE